MAKLTGAKKAAFLERMAKGRRKAARTKPAATGKKKTAKAAAKKKTAAKKPNTGGHRFRVTRDPGHSTYRVVRPSDGKILKKGLSHSAALHFADTYGKKKNPARKKTGKPRHAHRRNSAMTDAEAMYETFHQQAPGRIVDYETVLRYPDKFAELGKLKELRVSLDNSNPDFPLTHFGDCCVACTPDGRNIYFIGGDQSLDLGALGIASDKDMVELGPCNYIEYHTKKGFHDFAPTNYWHLFGEENEVLPILCYDRLNKTLFLVGGDYTVKYEGITN